MAYMKDRSGRRLDSFRAMNADTASPARVMYRNPANRSGSGWDVPAQTNRDAASTPNYTSDAYYGDRCVRIVTSGGGQHVYALRTGATTAFNGSDCFVRVTLKVMNYNFTILSVIVANASATTVGTATLAFVAGTGGAGANVIPAGEWVTLDIPQSKFSGNPNWADLQFFRVGVTDSGGAADVRIHSVDLVKRDPFNANPNGMVVISADDSHPTQYSVLLPAMQARGWSATLHPIPGAHGTSGFLTDAQVLEMSAAGWDIGAHCYDASSHAVGLQNLTSPQRLAEFRACVAWQKSLGLPQSPSHAWPLGTHSTAADADVALFWSASRLASSIDNTLYETITPARPFSLAAMNITAGTAAITTAAGLAHAQKGVLYLMTHSFLTSGGDANTITPTALTAALDAVAASGCEVVTMAEALRRSGLN